MNPKPDSIHIGTSGWHYVHWQGPFYPDDLGPERYLEFYADRFHTVEINNSFYQLPTERALSAWRDTVPPGFIFAVKGSRFITHMKKLKDPEKTLPPFLNRVSLLEDKLGPILFQLPPGWHSNVDRLKSFLAALSKEFQYTFEFRDPSWFNQQVYDTLSGKDAAFCIYDLDEQLSPKIVTAKFVYIRLHGPDGPYQGNYSTKTLSTWAKEFASWSKQGKSVYCYFDNDQMGYAAKNALKLLEIGGWKES